MHDRKRIRDWGVTVGTLPTGARNAITDVPGVTVGHTTLDDGPVKTGVTAVLPHPGNLFQDKVLAASYVLNGFGKTAGTIQIDELGTLETPILLTNTLSVGTVSDALIEYMLDRNPEIGITTGTVNPVVCECNDMHLNDIRGRHVKKEHVLQALAAATADFEEGAVGAGTGMACYGFKGGIGTASRVIEIPGGDDHPSETYTVGVLVLSNFGLRQDLTITGIPAGRLLAEPPHTPEASTDEEALPGDETEKGSIIILIATDLPASERQLKRLAKRAGVGLARTGSHIGNGSGDIALAFSTANRVRHDQSAPTVPMRVLNENRIDLAFRAVIESTEEAVLNSMVTARTTTGRDGHTLRSLAEHLGDLLGQHPLSR